MTLRIVPDWTPQDGHLAIAEAVALTGAALWLKQTIENGLEAFGKWLEANSPQPRDPRRLPPSLRHGGPSSTTPEVAARVQADREPWRRGRKAPNQPSPARSRQRRLL